MIMNIINIITHIISMIIVIIISIVIICTIRIHITLARQVTARVPYVCA